MPYAVYRLVEAAGEARRLSRRRLEGYVIRHCCIGEEKKEVAVGCWLRVHRVQTRVRYGIAQVSRTEHG